MKNIIVSDVTLKKLAGDREVSLLFREKTAIASFADSIGADAVELAPIKNLREDTIIYKTIAQKVNNAVVAIPVGFSKEEVDAAFECVKEAKNPRLQIEVPTSTLQMEYTYHVKAEKMLSKIGELVAYAKTLLSDVEFVALDATRADEDFIISAVKEAEKNGASAVTLSDDAGISLPEDIEALTKKIKAEINVPLYLSLNDKTNMALASAVLAIKAGADGFKCAMAGKDALLTGEFSDALATFASLNAKTNLQNTKIHRSIEDMLSSINHQAYDEVEVSDKKKILLDSDSTIADVIKASAVLGYDITEEDAGNIHKALTQIWDKKGAVGAKELEAIIASNAMQAPSAYHLESYTTTSSSLANSMSQVTLKCDNEIICGVANGDGPIDSAFRAIEQCIGHHYELDDFQVQSVTEGKEALGSALVRLRYNGKLYSGNGTSTDIVAASLRAYINALNKIVFEEE